MAWLTDRLTDKLQYIGPLLHWCIEISTSVVFNEKLLCHYLPNIFDVLISDKDLLSEIETSEPSNSKIVIPGIPKKCTDFTMSYLQKHRIWRLQIFYSNVA